MKVETRPADGKDVDWLSDLFARAMRRAITAARGDWDSKREDAQFRAQLQIADTQVIRLKGADVGFITVRALDARRLELHTICIQPGLQCAGIGAQVVARVLNAARAEGTTVELSVLKANPRARQFYERMGFAKIDSSMHHIRMRWPAINPAEG